MNKSQKIMLSNKIQTNKSTHYMSYVCNVLENTHQYRWGIGVGAWKEGDTKEPKEPFAGNGLFISLTVVMVPQVYA